MNQSVNEIHSFEFLVLEHRPENETDGPASRVLTCTKFSKDGMLLNGQPRFDIFPVTLSIPQDGSTVDALVEVTSGNKNSFNVKFINPSKELVKKLSWWDEKVKRPSTSQNAGIDA